MKNNFKRDYMCIRYSIYIKRFYANDFTIFPNLNTCKNQQNIFKKKLCVENNILLLVMY